MGAGATGHSLVLVSGCVCSLPAHTCWHTPDCMSVCTGVACVSLCSVQALPRSPGCPATPPPNCFLSSPCVLLPNLILSPSCLQPFPVIPPAPHPACPWPAPPDLSALAMASARTVTLAPCSCHQAFARSPLSLANSHSGSAPHDVPSSCPAFISPARPRPLHCSPPSSCLLTCLATGTSWGSGAISMVLTPQLPLRAVPSVVHTMTLFSPATRGLGLSTPLPRSGRLCGPHQVTSSLPCSSTA